MYLRVNTPVYPDLVGTKVTVTPSSVTFSVSPTTSPIVKSSASQPVKEPPTLTSDLVTVCFFPSYTKSLIVTSFARLLISTTSLISIFSTEIGSDV